MNVARTEITDFLNNLLLTNFKLQDATYNGLQVEGKNFIRKIAFAVDASLQTFEEAVAENADLLITHHGLIWGGWNKIVKNRKESLKILLENELNLYVSHLPLDIHPQVGNNIRILKTLGAQTGKRFADIGFIAKWQEGISYSSFLKLVREQIGEPMGEMPFGPKIFDSVAISSGSFSQALLETAISTGIKTILTGEGSSLLYHTAFESGINIIFGGHYATETFGVKALMKEIQNHFDIETVFLDIPTGW